jgi:hypothetical protein
MTLPDLRKLTQLTRLLCRYLNSIALREVFETSINCNRYFTLARCA